MHRKEQITNTLLSALCIYIHRCNDKNNIPMHSRFAATQTHTDRHQRSVTATSQQIDTIFKLGQVQRISCDIILSVLPVLFRTNFCLDCIMAMAMAMAQHDVTYNRSKLHMISGWLCRRV